MTENQDKEYYYFGIDPGVKTGVAEWCNGQLVNVQTLSVIGALERVMDVVRMMKGCGVEIKIFIEDARKRKWIAPKAGKERLQGVGSVKRDSKIWQEFCVHYGIDFELVAPKNNKTKTSRDLFKKITGYTGRTSEHARDAVMLVWGAYAVIELFIIVFIICFLYVIHG